MSECVSCIRNAAANVTLLRDGSRGAGHITVVIAMHLGVPQIYSDTEVLREYFPTPGFGLPVPVGDKDEVARRMLEVLEQAAKPEGDRFIDARKEFALAWLSHGSSSRRLSEVVLATIEGRQPALIDPAWSAWLQKYRVGP
jgi:glycosyltransferase involved in cell wall biosynthesis